MSVTRKEMKEEALARMVMLHLHPKVISDFNNEDQLYVSDNGSVLVQADEEYLKLVRDFEERCHSLVYHLIYSSTDCGGLLTFLYVSSYDEGWELDRTDIKEGTPLVYVKNMTDNKLSEYGSIGVRASAGGLIRVW